MKTVDERVAAVAEKKLMLDDSEFRTYVPANTAFPILEKFKSIKELLDDEKKTLLDRKADAEQYATRSRVPPPPPPLLPSIYFYQRGTK